MSEILVVNASPLIFLSRVDGLHWLVRLRQPPVLVPQAVLDEIEVGADGEEIGRELRSRTWIQIVDDAQVTGPLSGWDLGRGETQVLARAVATPGAIAVLDDRQAPRGARAMGIPLLGTLGIVLAAKREGWIPRARPVLTALLNDGLYLSPSLVEAALAEVGE